MTTHLTEATQLTVNANNKMTETGPGLSALRALDLIIRGGGVGGEGEGCWAGQSKDETKKQDVYYFVVVWRIDNE